MAKPKKVSSPQRKKHKTTKGPHGGANEYESEEFDDKFKMHDAHTENRDEPGKVTTPKLNKEAGYHESAKRVEALLSEVGFKKRDKPLGKPTHHFDDETWREDQHVELYKNILKGAMVKVRAASKIEDYDPRESLKEAINLLRQALKTWEDGPQYNEGLARVAALLEAPRVTGGRRPKDVWSHHPPIGVPSREELEAELLELEKIFSKIRQNLDKWGSRNQQKKLSRFIKAVYGDLKGFF